MITELVPDQLHLVGGPVPLDGRASWAPPEATGFQSSNTYILREDDRVLVIDPGLPYLQDEVTDGVAQLIPEGDVTSVFLTRAQIDCVGNLGAVAATVPITSLYTGGVANPFDQFDEATGMDPGGRAAHLRLNRPLRKGETPVVEFDLDVMSPALRILNSFWIYHRPTKTLFTSDIFTHSTTETADAVPVTDTVEDADVLEAAARGHLNATLWWLPLADNEQISANIEELFGRHDVETIAPGRGNVLRGREVVKAHLDAVLAALHNDTEENA
jgi:flavorubredoxin